MDQDNNNDYQDYNDEEEQTQFSVLNVLRNEAEKESTIQDLNNLIKFIYNEIYNNKSAESIITLETKEEFVKLYNMVFELLEGIQQATELSLTNNEMMSNLFEFYQISDELRYYFALFNGDIKMKINKIISNINNNNNNNKSVNYFNQKDQINFELILFKSYINNNSANNNNHQNKVIELFNYNRNEINNKLNSIVKNDEQELKSIQNELDNPSQKEQEQKEEPSNEMIEQKEVIERSFFIIFQIFTSFIYNLQSLGEKLLLSLQDFSDSSSYKKELYNTLIDRDLVNLNSIIQLLKLLINQNDNQIQNQQEFISNSFNKIQYNNNDNNNKDKSTSFINSIQIVIQNYVIKNNLNEESILEFLNN